MQKIYYVDKKKHIAENSKASYEYIECHNEDYTDLKNDFMLAKHFNEIKDIEFGQSSGVLLNGININDLFQACVYLERKYDFEFNGCYEEMVVIRFDEFTRYFGVSDSEFSDSQGFGFQFMGRENNDWPTPDWMTTMDPIIVLTSKWNLDSCQIDLNAIEDRLVIFILVDNYTELDSNDDSVDNTVENFIFENNLEFARILKPESSYLVTILDEFAQKKGFQFDEQLNLEVVVNLVKKFRGMKFEGVRDFERIFKRLNKVSDSKTLTIDDFEKVLVKTSNIQTDVTETQKKNTINHLVGLDEIKTEMEMIVKKLQFNQKRNKTLGLIGHEHTAAVFMGNPGTAKTTMARLFGRMLADAGVLRNSIFLEVSRKDLIGQYVGWTAVKVAEVFERAKGGTLFIDEAYSLYENNNASFADEAMAELMVQMENNPDTLVVFAGYPNEMRTFINNSNPGFKSRLTTIIEFKDYTVLELCHILYKLAEEEKFEIMDKHLVEKVLIDFIDKIRNYDDKGFGNGRLMRKLLKRAVSFKVLRDPEEYIKLTIEDIKKATIELLQSENNAKKVKPRQIVGF